MIYFFGLNYILFCKSNSFKLKQKWHTHQEEVLVAATVVDVEVLAGEEVVIEEVAAVLEEEVVAEVRTFMLHCDFYLNGSMRMRQCLESKLLTL
ncbi:hypothetical protein EYC80_002672 [Monilinia laxa]|uniref:Uncharacterized protein n=1 Tax=Monilinia laxa TaxID=61186 RepID=A0A5N6K4K0_MONLA|nr:hypothetical protein EYC80_002672 [Monilinia laxa]